MSAVVAATFFDGRTSRTQPVQICAGAGLLGISAAGWQRSEALSSVRVTPRVAGIHRTLVLADGGLLQVDDNDAVDAWFPGHGRGAALIDRLERHPAAVAVSLLATAVSIVGLIFFGIPYAAKKVAEYVPESVERAMGEQTVALLDRFGFDDSDLPQKRRDELRAIFKRYVASLPHPERYQLRFMKAKMPYAFALPGGIIVMTDEMVRIVGAVGDDAPNSAAGSAIDDGDDDTNDSAAGSAKGDDATAEHSKGAVSGEANETAATVAAGAADESRSEAGAKSAPTNAELTTPEKRFLAVIAHEIGHEEHKHVLRSVLQNSAVVLVGAYFTGDVSSASALVVSVPTFLLDSHYSRAFETEADNYAFASLAAHGISPESFAEVMSRLQSAQPRRFRSEEGSYLSTHPATLDRITSAHLAAMAFQKEHAGNR